MEGYNRHGCQGAFDSTSKTLLLEGSRKEDVKLTSGDRVVYARKIKLSLKTGSQRVEGCCITAVFLG